MRKVPFFLPLAFSGDFFSTFGLTQNKKKLLLAYSILPINIYMEWETGLY